MPDLTLILGGARSGKSTYAEKLAARLGPRLAYIATAQPLDGEMATRIAAHRARRPPDWITLEIPSGVARSLQSRPLEVDGILLDCLTLLVSNLLMHDLSGQDDPEQLSPQVEAQAAALVQAEIAGLLDCIQASSFPWIIVSNEVGMGLVPPYPLGRLYRDLLGWANQRLAARASQVYLMVAGLPWLLNPPQNP
ncbi:MAG: bifunctional adenosylcobinamide kinase/adenosylcobinamide-phosphate guanylyltransferase [Chloroflexota bacterium]